PKMNAAPFLTPRLDGSTSKNPVSGIGSSVIARPIRIRSSVTVCTSTCVVPGGARARHPLRWRVAEASRCLVDRGDRERYWLWISERGPLLEAPDVGHHGSGGLGARATLNARIRRSIAVVVQPV